MRTAVVRTRTMSLLVAVTSTLVLAMPAPGEGTTLAAPSPAAVEHRTVEVFSPTGHITRIDADLPAGAPMAAEELAAADGGVSALQVTGDSANRYDLVFLGDGYTAEDMDLYHEHVADKWRAIVETEPFTTYADFFNVWVVDVVSNESGVDNDPTPPTDRDTALDMYFWCSGVERGLCVDETKARQAADLAPEADQIVVLGNSTKYGGIGGSVATSSGGNAAAGLITVHELGHSLGGLADEYDYYLRAGLEDDAAQDVTIPAPFTYYPSAVYGEPAGVNITAESDPEQIRDTELKWWRWIGEMSPDGTQVGAYEGGGYYRYGMYRPTEDSLMHTLGTPEDPNAFNSPSREQMIARFYATVRPVDSATSTTAPLAPGDVAEISVLDSLRHTLDIRWYLGDEELTTERGNTAITVPDATAQALRVRVTDTTADVRDPAVIDELLTQEIAWSLVQ